MSKKQNYIAYQRAHNAQQRLLIRGEFIGEIIHQYIHIEPITFEKYHQCEEIILHIRDAHYTLVGHHFTELYRLLQHQKIEYMQQFVGANYHPFEDDSQPIITHIRREHILLE